jgi:type IV secretory pathway VirJ component
MKQIFRVITAAFILAFLAVNGFAQEQTHSLTFGRFGKVTLYQKQAKPEHVALFISGDGGWNNSVIDVARDLAARNTLVIGIDINHYLHSLNNSKEKCLYPASDFEALSQFIQKKLQFDNYHIPVLIGYSSGAALVYAILAQAPPNTFKGGISLGFSPYIQVTKTFCKGTGLKQKKAKNNNGYDLLPSDKVHLPWIVLQGEIDKVCSPEIAKKFVKQAPNAMLVLLPGVGHGFSVPRHWKPELINSFQKILAKSETLPTPIISTLKDLPVEEVPAAHSDNNILAVILSGDGGWASIDQGLSKTLSDSGISAVGLNSLKYFWKRRTPQGTSVDLERIIRYYMATWHKDELLLIGYSLGADVLPFMAYRLPNDLKQRTRLITLLSPSATVDFQFHLSYWLGGGDRKTDLHVLPEIKKLQGLPLLCIYGDDEKDSTCKKIPANLAKVVPLTGGHHYDGNYQNIANLILKNIRKRMH